MTPEEAAALRAPFPPEQVGQIPKGGVTLDYVGHAATTDRLLQVDRDWQWEPMGVDAHGLPVLDEDGNLWITLTVCEVSRHGVGDGPTMKERIGDAIRNAAMRFGVALDLWAKEPLPQHDPAVVYKSKPVHRSKPKTPTVDQWSTPDTPTPAPVDPPSPGPGVGAITLGQTKLLNVLAAGAGITDRALLHEGIGKVVGREITSVKQLTKGEATTVIEQLQTRQATA